MTDDMIQTLTPQEAQALIAERKLDVVDVRDVSDFTKGHIPSARLVPLKQLETNPRAALKEDGILFVCARGVRSLAAAKLAEAVGLARLYSVAGGTLAWVSAGLPLEQDMRAAAAGGSAR
jgi:rhodanese-related sulfurtransferase